MKCSLAEAWEEHPDLQLSNPVLGSHPLSHRQALLKWLMYPAEESSRVKAPVFSTLFLVSL